MPDAVGRAPGYLGLRNCAFFLILAETGARVNALRQLDGTDCVEMPSGRMRLFLTDAASVLPRHTVAEAGGWQGLERLDDHYVQPRVGTIWAKLSRQAQDTPRPVPSERGTGEAAHAP